MEKLEFYQRLKESLESDYFKEEIQDRSKQSRKYGRKFLEKCLYFLISTRDFDNLKYFINHMYNETFPYHYLREVKGLNPEQIEQEIYNNFIRNGFLFHITRNSNIDEILSKGLLTLNDKYNCDVYEECVKLNYVYDEIKRRNKGNNNDVLRLVSLINVPGSIVLNKERFNTIYLSSELSYILDTYGSAGEFSNFLLDDIFTTFTGYYDQAELDKDKKIDILLQAIPNNKIDITEDEIFYILEFIKKFSEERKTPDHEKAILMVPNNCLINPSIVFQSLYRSNKLKLTTETIIHHNEGEIEHQGSIKAEDIIAITPETDNTYKVKIKEM